jgi:CRP-like cAMP-binding protein
MVTGGMMPETLKTLGTMDRILFLRQVPLFENLDPDDLESIAELAREKVFGPGEFLCRESDVGDELFVIVSGSVRVEKHVEGTTKTLRRMEAGSHIGELAVLREQPRSANVVAEGAGVRTLVLSGEAVRSILRERPEVAMAMLTSLAERLSTTS